MMTSDNIAVFYNIIYDGEQTCMKKDSETYRLLIKYLFLETRKLFIRQCILDVTHPQ